MSNHEVIPAILAKTSEELERMIRVLEPHVQRVHLDIMDGVFVPNTTVKGYEELAKIRTNLEFDVHLMVANPIGQMYNWYNTGGIRRFCVHAEERVAFRELLEQIRINNKETCITLNPETRWQEVYDNLDLADAVQFMTVKPGFQKQAFMDEVLGKISDFRENNPEMPIMVDGGITTQTAQKALRAGASILVSGSYIMSSPDPAKALDELRML